jgi:hypothetical protein
MMKFSLLPFTRPDLTHVVRNMRAKDREEIFATMPSDHEDELVDYGMVLASLRESYTRIAYWEDKPVAVLGAMEPWPSVCEVWCYGTDDFQKVAFSLTKHIRRNMIPTLLAKGVRRAHCRSLATHTVAHDWLRSLGAKLEDERPLRSWGKNGEDFILFEWHRENMLAMFQREAA